MTDAADTTAFLSASTARADALLALEEEGELTRSAFYDRLDTSRRTVKRALSALVERGYVTECCGTYRPTALGAVVADAHRSYRECTSTAERLAPVLSRVDAEAFDPDVSSLADAELVVRNDAAPLAPLDRFVELRAASSTVRVLSPVVQSKSVAQAAERVRNDGVTFEAVLTADAVDAAREAYEDAFEASLSADGFEAHRYEGELPFMLGLLDDTVTVGVTEEGVPHAMLVTENETVRAWAEETFEAYRDAADALA